MEELFEFANKVRAAGGGNPIDALMPAVPEDPTKCLIARNLNFNCAVDGTKDDRWKMSLDDEAVRDRIAEALDLEVCDEYGEAEDETTLEFSVILPESIGQVASDFDEAGTMYRNIVTIGEDAEHYSLDRRKLLVEMEPYIEAARDEAYSLATFINPDGSIVA